MPLRIKEWLIFLILQGVENPQIDILSEDFFNKIRKLKQKNLAFELLKKITKRPNKNTKQRQYHFRKKV